MLVKTARANDFCNPFVYQELKLSLHFICTQYLQLATCVLQHNCVLKSGGLSRLADSGVKGDTRSRCESHVEKIHQSLEILAL
jgi:hypothetical protein